MKCEGLRTHTGMSACEHTSWFTLSYAAELNNVIPFSLVFRRFVFHISSRWKLRLQDLSHACHAIVTLLSHFYLQVWTGFLALQSSHFKFKILILVSKAQRRLAPKYLADVILQPLSALRIVHSTVKTDLAILVPHSKTAMTQSRPFTTTVPSIGMRYLDL